MCPIQFQRLKPIPHSKISILIPAQFDWGPQPFSNPLGTEPNPLTETNPSCCAFSSWHTSHCANSLLDLNLRIKVHFSFQYFRNVPYLADVNSQPGSAQDGWACQGTNFDKPCQLFGWSGLQQKHNKKRKVNALPISSPKERSLVLYAMNRAPSRVKLEDVKHCARRQVLSGQSSDVLILDHKTTQNHQTLVNKNNV